MFARAVAVSLLWTLAYTAWNSRSKMEISARLLIEEATLARLASQDQQTAQFIQQRYVDVCSDAVLLRYAVLLARQRERQRSTEAAARGDAGGSSGSGSGDEADTETDKETETEIERSVAAAAGLEEGELDTVLQRKASEMLETWGVVLAREGAEGQGQGGEGQGQAEVWVCEVDGAGQLLDHQHCGS